MQPIERPVVDDDEDVLDGTQYKILRALGSGATATVYEVKHRVLGSYHVVKLLRTCWEEDPQAIERIIKEGRAQAAFSHPHLVRVTDAGFTDRLLPYLVMEKLGGKTLYSEMRQRRLFWPEAVGFAIQIARALEFVHSRGIIHRDLKPANIFLTESGVIKVLDWGLMKLLDAGVGDAQAYPTDPNLVVGTAHYIAPEYISGGKIDDRCDVYALGVVLFEMLTRHKPFENEGNPMVACVSLDSEPPSKWVRTIPEKLDRIVLKAIDRDPRARYQTASEFREALEGLTSERLDRRVVALTALVSGVVSYIVLVTLISALIRALVR